MNSSMIEIQEDRASAVKLSDDYARTWTGTEKLFKLTQNAAAGFLNAVDADGDDPAIDFNDIIVLSGVNPSTSTLTLTPTGGGTAGSIYVNIFIAGDPA